MVFDTAKTVLQHHFTKAPLVAHVTLSPLLSLVPFKVFNMHALFSAFPGCSFDNMVAFSLRYPNKRRCCSWRFLSEQIRSILNQVQEPACPYVPTYMRHTVIIIHKWKRKLCSTNSTQPISTTLQRVVDTDTDQPTPVEPLVPK